MFRNTSLCTSRAILATVPGFDSPKASLRSEKDLYVSARTAVTALFSRKPKGASFSSSKDDIAPRQMGLRVAGWRDGSGRDTAGGRGEGRNEVLGRAVVQFGRSEDDEAVKLSRASPKAKLRGRLLP